MKSSIASASRSSQQVFVCFECMRGCLVSPFAFFFGAFKVNSSSVLVSVVVIFILMGQNEHLNRNTEWDCKTS